MKLLSIIFFAALFLTGCKSTPPTYYYGEYQKAVYNYFKSDGVGIAQQITVMQSVIDKAPTKGLLVPPGAHAHLGMLYFESGSPDLGMSHFVQEKELFPESNAYIDFLISNVMGEQK